MLFDSKIGATRFISKVLLISVAEIFLRSVGANTEALFIRQVNGPKVSWHSRKNKSIVSNSARFIFLATAEFLRNLFSLLATSVASALDD